MKKIYLDDFFAGCISGHPEEKIDHKLNYVQYTDHNQIPNDCDIIAKIYWHTRRDEILDEINMLLPRTKRLLVFVSECVTGEMKDFLRHPTLQKCECFAEIVEPNDPPYRTAITWFMQNHHIYRYQPWAQSLVERLHPCVDARPKMFDCLLGHKKPHRDWLADRLDRSGLRELFIYNYFRTGRALGQWPDLPVDTGQKNLKPDMVLPVDMYNQSYYSIVAETCWSNQYAFFTEKTAKPIIAKRPFVYFAGRNYLHHLRNLGFKTFGTVIDESYDLIEDNEVRWEAAWQQVETLCRADPIDVHARLLPVLEHNFAHFMNTDWYLPIRQSLNCV